MRINDALSRVIYAKPAFITPFVRLFSFLSFPPVLCRRPVFVSLALNIRSSTVVTKTGDRYSILPPRKVSIDLFGTFLLPLLSWKFGFQVHIFNKSPDSHLVRLFFFFLGWIFGFQTHKLYSSSLNKNAPFPQAKSTTVERAETKSLR